MWQETSEHMGNDPDAIELPHHVDPETFNVDVAARQSKRPERVARIPVESEIVRARIEPATPEERLRELWRFIRDKERKVEAMRQELKAHEEELKQLKRHARSVEASL